uniref:PGG domain-containing protein n=1 Tax=Fagus sylvatica TaxID=28930 RepID=A0A2N9FU08_FAGSY
MDVRIEKIKHVAQQGNIDDFYNLIQEDAKLLEHIDELPFVDTPLHIAASFGNIPIAMEMMGLKPSFARKLNPYGFSPIHLALQNGHTEMVHRLLQFDGDLVHVKAKEHITPLHYVAKTDYHLDLLPKFLSICPDSITDVTIRNETALHIAMKNNVLDAFKLLAVRHLLYWGLVDINAKNLEGNTAWDILQDPRHVDNKEMRVMLHRFRAKPGSSLSTVPSYAKYLKLPKFKYLQVFRTLHAREMRKLSDEKRNTLLVIATLLVTISYQAVLSPPGSVWQDDSKPETNQIQSLNNSTTAAHKAGTAIAFSRMDERIESVNSVAQQGNIDEFYNLIKGDVKLLEDMDELPFVNTPFHIAASSGHIPFALEMMGLKPSFARKPNPEGFSPIHLALQNGHTEMVRRLLQVDGDLVNVKGKERITPLHYVAATGDQLDLLVEFLSFCPDSIADVTIRNETALHIALKRDNLEAFKVLVEWLAVSQLFALAPDIVRVDVKNLEGKTAWDILQGQTKVDNGEIRGILCRARGIIASRLPTIAFCAYNITWTKFLVLERFRTGYARRKMALSMEKRIEHLVIAVLLLTVSYQAILGPPFGLWEDDYEAETNQTLCNTNTTAAYEAGSCHLGTDQTQYNTTVAHEAGNSH